MTLEDFVSGIQEQLGFRTDLRNIILREAGDTKETLELDSRLYPIKFLTNTKVITDIEPDLPFVRRDNFLYVDEQKGSVWWQNEDEDNWIRVPQVDAQQEDPNETGQPVAYYVEHDCIHFLPIPDKRYRVQVTYTAKSNRGIGEGDRWLLYAGRLLQAETGFIVAGKIQNERALGIFTAQIQNERTRLLASNINENEYTRVMN